MQQGGLGYRFAAGCVRVLNWLSLRPVYLLCRRSALREEGWFHALRHGECIDAQGRPIPWIPYAARDFIEGRLNKTMKVFEYGAGGSTRWWAARVAAVASVEHHAGWHGKVAAMVPANARVLHVPLEPAEGYVDSILGLDEKFDIIFIDGRHRALCLRRCRAALGESGVIILDNSERPEYADALQEILAQGFRRLDIAGMAPLVSYKSQTTILYRSHNIFEI